MRFLRLMVWVVPVAVVIAVVAGLTWLNAPPRLLGPYLERRAAGHHPLIVRTGAWVNALLMRLDRGEATISAPGAIVSGARLSSAAVPSGGTTVLVSTADEASAAIAGARPGDVITFLPGSYRFQGRAIEVHRPGKSDARITVRAVQADTAFLEFDMQEGFAVSAPYWTFENLNIRGTCSDHFWCEHAFHVVGKGTHFVARNNRITDFNAHFKINGAGSDMPDQGLIEDNTITNTTVRATGNSVTPVDLVAASQWAIRGNLISDFIKGGGDRISYGGFAKGGGSGNRFERNVVLCERRLRGAPGQRVGLSLGGGGTGAAYCRDKRCITEQDGGVIKTNLIAYCSDDGIYINRAATSTVAHNTVIDSAGISVRFAESSADLEGNLVDGMIRSRDGAVIRSSENRETNAAYLYLGMHPVRGLFVDVDQMDFRWKGEPSRVSVVTSDQRQVDLCGAFRPELPTHGAVENFAACVKQRF